VSPSDPTYSRRVVEADIIEEDEAGDADGDLAGRKGKGPPAHKGWGIIHVKAKLHAKQVFFRLCQLDRKFQDRGGDKPDPEYPELTLLVVRKFTAPPRDESTPGGMEYAYLEGATGKAASVGARIDGVRGGEYLVVYKAAVTPEDTCRKLNLVVAGREDLVSGAAIKRIKPSSFKPAFFSRLLERHARRVKLAAHYDQPNL